ncbi:MAG: hypothetical protein ACOCXG_03330 [Nanoarchaeota archaeon]
MKINPIYTQEETLKEMQEYFEEEASISLVAFLNDKLKEIYPKLEDSHWILRKNPLSVRRYKLPEKNISDIKLLNFIEFFKSKDFIEFLDKITGFQLRLLNLGIYKYNHRCFTTLGHKHKDRETIEVIYDLTKTWNQNSGGTLTYATKQADLFYLSPTFNTLTILFKPEDVMSYLKYINNLAEENKILRIEMSFEILEDDFNE